MPKELWKLPVPATALLGGPDFSVLPQRKCKISFQIEGEESTPLNISNAFESVQAFKCTYMASLDPAIINSAYGKLIELEAGPWLIELDQRSLPYYTKTGKAVPALKHLAIYFDDGPCFEIICVAFQIL